MKQLPTHRCSILLAGLVAVAIGCAVQYGTPFLMPALRSRGLSLTEAGILAGCPIAGLLATLYLWGMAADRWGERRVLAVGLGLGGAILLAGGLGGGMLWLAACFLFTGAATAAVHAASGRLVLGWFTARERGRAMAVRQTAQPLGVAIAALTLPFLAGAGLPVTLALLGGGCLAAALLVVLVVRDPPRPAATDRVRTASPYRSPVLWRIHGASALLVVPQFVVATYAFVYLIDVRDWAAAPAGRLLAAAHVAGAVARLAAGFWSDRVGSRLRPMRLLTLVIGLAVLCLAVAVLSRSALAVAALIITVVVSVSTNGLAFTAVAEYAGSAWAGRALGMQNTAQNAMGAVTPPVFALLINTTSYAGAFAAAVVFPLAAWALVPVAAKQRHCATVLKQKSRH